MTILIACPLAAHAATVGGSVLGVPSPYVTLADAFAVAVDGDVIEVDGSYSGNDPELLVDRRITVVGVRGRPSLATTGVDGLFVVDAGGALTLDHVAFDGGNAGRAVSVVLGTATIRESTFDDLAGPDGGAILMDDDADNELTVIDCTFTDGDAAGDGGFLSLLGGATSISGSTFDNGVAQVGAAVCARGPASLTVDRSRFTGGLASKEGGAIYAESTAIVTRSGFFRNGAGDGGGAVRSKGGELTVSECWFEGNSATGSMKHGGAIWQEPGLGSYNRVFFCENDATKWGAGLFAKSGGVVASELVFALNHDDFGGAGLRLEDAPVGIGEHSLNHVTFAANVATASTGQALSTGGAMRVTNGFFGFHSGTCTINTAASVTGVVTWTTFSGNTTDVSLETDVSDPNNVMSADFPIIGFGAPTGCELTDLIPGGASDLVGSGSDGENRGGLLGSGHWPDADDDGVLFLDDCNDDPPDGATFNPSEPEVPGDGLDQDCSGTEKCFVDADGDGAGESGLVDSDDLDCLDPGEAPAPNDVCPGADDRLDADGDGFPDDCDTCANGDDDADADGDTVCDEADVCPGFDDLVDTDGDGVPNGCDDCGSPDDEDGDGVADDCNRCPGFDDRDDIDDDSVPDLCDPCPIDAPDDDTDDDHVCNSDDACPGFDDREDDDLDNVPDACDDCPGEVGDDIDGDGVCDPVDPCPYDFPDDPDGDGVCSRVDGCPLDPDPACGPVVRGAPGGDHVVGCGCATGGSAGGGWLALLLVGARRYARRAAR